MGVPYYDENGSLYLRDQWDSPCSFIDFDDAHRSFDDDDEKLTWEDEIYND